MASRPLVIHCSGPDNRDVLRAEPPAIQPGACSVHFAELAELRQRREALHHLLDEKERERAARFKFEVDRERYILGHGWMRELLGHYTGVPPKDVAAERGRFGKPYLPDERLTFNLSDTKDAVVLAVALDLDLGVDVETVDRRVDHTAVGAHYFTPEEQEHIARSDDAKRTFLELWTRKEAVLKASGVGIMDDLRSLRVDQAVNKLTIAHPEFVALAAAEYHVRTWRIDPAHLISLATPVPVEHVLLFGA
jgi:4'-phosphopantetheinyl transferase